MRILHYFGKYYPVIGGTEIDTRELSIELARMGHKVSVFTTDALELENYRWVTKYIDKASFEDFGVKVFRFHRINSNIHRCLTNVLLIISDGTKRFGIAENDLFLSLEALSNSPLVPGLFRTLANSRFFDVINGTRIGNGELLFLERLCLKNKTPFVFTPRSHLLDPYHRKSSALWVKIARDATALIVLTPPEKDYYINEGINPDKIFITGIGVLPRSRPSDSLSFRLRYRIPLDNKIVLHIGRMDKYKGAGLIIESMKEVWKKEPETSLVLIGKSTGYTAEIEEIANNDKRIVLLPNASEKDKTEALFCSSLLIHPSLFESFGKVFLEAWSAEKPVVGARTPVNKYVIDEWKDGLLLDALTTEELAKKILFLLENESVAKKMGKRGKEKVLRSYTWEKIARQTLEVYKWAKKK